jgi:hypothetical protein
MAFRQVSKLAPYLKAVVAGAIAAGTSLITALGDNILSSQEAVTAAVAFLVGLGVVAAVPNRPS